MILNKMSKESCGDKILKNVLDGLGVARATSQGYLGQFSDNLVLVVGAFEAIEDYLIHYE
tara:strand:- start:476 stop:655 length:180 start_codon:yes stop_codon:yes gene_type:complete